MRTRTLALLAALVLGLAGCGGDDPPVKKAQRDCTWTIGTLGALSGDYASIGQPIFQGIEYAVDEVNTSGDLPCAIELQPEDTQGDPNQAPPLARSLVDNERVVGVVGPYFSGETLATGRIFSQADVAFITPSATGAMIDDQGYTTFFRVVADDAIQGDVAARYIASLGAATVAVVHDNQDYSKGLADAVSAGLGDAAVGPFIIDPAETDYSAVVAEVANADPQVVFYGGYSPQAGPFLKQLREAGVEATFISDDGTKDASFGDLAGPASEGTQVTCPCADPLQIPAAKDFVEGIQARYDRPPGTFAADAYDATRLIFRALSDLSGDEPIDTVRAAVVDYLTGVDGFSGVTKHYTFSDTGQVEIGPEGVWIYEWSQRDGDFIAVGPASELIDK
ncbi:MAG: branched-chain amino acid transport system substrate-binding protein [Actinomycetota bacterium]|jgi:branched-chain amino acid transport system substrate-binding protein|nr:branched-chain amino acid transport system substrate-binding protein [Actinomycetota bacterium]